ncbi:hypothetical protein D3C85_1322950 [compost metagenome]
MFVRRPVREDRGWIKRSAGISVTVGLRAMAKGKLARKERGECETTCAFQCLLR